MNSESDVVWHWERIEEPELKEWARDRVRAFLSETLEADWGQDADVQNAQFALDQFLLSYEDPGQSPPAPARRQLAGAMQRWAWNAHNSEEPAPAARAAHLCAVLNRFAHAGDPLGNDHYKRMLGLFVTSQSRLSAAAGLPIAEARAKALEAVKAAALDRPDEYRGQVPFWLKRRTDLTIVNAYIDFLKSRNEEADAERIRDFLTHNLADAFSLGLVDGQSPEGETLISCCRRFAPELHEQLNENGAFFHWREGVRIPDELGDKIDELAGRENLKEIARLLDAPVREYFDSLRKRIGRYISYHEPTLSSKHFKLDRAVYGQFDAARQMCRRGEFDEAMAEFFSVFERHVDNLMVESWLAYALANVGREQEATDHWSHLARRPRTTWCTHWNLGVVLHRQGDVEAALNRFLDAHAINPQAPDALAALMVLGMDLKRWSAVAAGAESYAGPSLLPAGFWACMQADNHEAAKRFLAQIQAGAMSGGDSFFLPPPEERLDEAALKRVYSYFVSRQRIQLGINYFAKKCQYQGGFFLNHRLYGELLERTGRLDEALNEFETEMSMTLRARIPPHAKTPRLVEVLELCRAYKRTDVALRLLEWAEAADIDFPRNIPLKRLARHFGYGFDAAAGERAAADEEFSPTPAPGPDAAAGENPEQAADPAPEPPAQPGIEDGPAVLEIAVLSASLPNDGAPTRLVVEVENTASQPVTDFELGIESNPPGVLELLEPDQTRIGRIEAENRMIRPIDVKIDPQVNALELRLTAGFRVNGRRGEETCAPPPVPLEAFTDATGHPDGLPADVFWFPNPLPVSRGLNFHGRESLIKRIIGGITPRTQMFIPYLDGIRGVGKTSILRFLADSAPGYAVPVYLDLETLVPNPDQGDLDDACLRLGRALAEAVNQSMDSASDWSDCEFDDSGAGREAFITLVKELTQSLADRDLVLLLLLDEVQNIFELGSGVESLLTFLRGLNQDGRLAMVLAGALRFNSLSEFDPGPILRSIRPQPVPFLDRAACDAAVETPAARFNVRVHPEALTRIWELTRGYPYFIQALGVQIMDSLGEERRNAVFGFDVDAAAVSFLNADQLFLHMLPEEPLSVEANTLLRQMLSAGLEGRSRLSADELKMRLPNGMRADAAFALQQLLDHGVLRLTRDNHYAASMDLLRDWLMARFRRSGGKEFMLPQARNGRGGRDRTASADCALFVDAENLLIGLRKTLARDKNVDIFEQPMNYPEHIARRLLDQARKLGGKVALKEAAAAWDRKELQALQPFAAAFGKYDYKIAYPANTKNNSVDFKLQSDVHAALSDPRNDNVGTYIIVGGDGDFQQLVLDIQGQNKRAVVWGLDSQTSRGLIDAVGRDNYADVTRLIS